MAVSTRPVALVTGAAGLIGRGITQRLLADGWCVAALDVDGDALAGLAHALGRDLEHYLPITADVADEAQVAGAVGQVTGAFGRLDGLVNNAAIADACSGPVTELAMADWQRRLAVNLTGAFATVKHATPWLAERFGAVVNIASTRALQSEPDSEAYAASKGGLLALTHALAVSLSGRVRVNAISPGWIDAGEGLTDLDHDQHPAGRVGRPADVAGLCAYLLSADAGFVTGENVVADGGMTRKMIYAE